MLLLSGGQPALGHNACRHLCAHLIGLARWGRRGGGEGSVFEALTMAMCTTMAREDAPVFWSELGACASGVVGARDVGRGGASPAGTDARGQPGGAFVPTAAGAAADCERESEILVRDDVCS
ncbi:unnamed protein product [Ostreobium quekettii]|uniref:Uncharacterized protein n=1 Tax=Ostreobium quekettii TaxID=121088 RepID=A0A8S1IMV7_9CHLO|nr:unnamed protein product [Ostreobium quekettii]